MVLGSCRPTGWRTGVQSEGAWRPRQSGRAHPGQTVELEGALHADAEWQDPSKGQRSQKERGAGGRTVELGFLLVYYCSYRYLAGSCLVLKNTAVCPRYCFLLFFNFILCSVLFLSYVPTFFVSCLLGCEHRLLFILLFTVSNYCLY